MEIENTSLENAMGSSKSGFKNTKLGKNVYRQLKRRGPPQPIPGKHQSPKPQREKT